MPKLIAIGLVAAFLGGCASNPALLAQSPSPCLTAPDTASSLTSFATEHLATDSAGLAAHGLPYRPSTVQLVTDSIVCRQVIDRYNQSLTDPAYHVQRAYVVNAGGAFLFHATALKAHRATYSFFDSTKAMRYTLEGLD